MDSENTSTTHITPIILIIVGVVVVGIIGLILYAVIKDRDTNSSVKNTTVIPTPYPIEQKNPGKDFTQQHTIPGKTKMDEILQNKDVIQSESLSSGDVKVTIKSINAFRPTEVVARNGIVIFERTIIPSDPGTSDRINLDQVKQTFGEPEALIPGTAHYGAFNNTYSYSTQGFVLIANPQNGHVYEIQSFIPMTTDQYMQTYGEQIKTEDRDKL